ncbi:MAG: branched-chain amino acid ABC transporter permease [Bacteroidaceae bacterium]|nr:branched-chain amino acid ABC transporter permease [Bacteroidaceae bacterium]
MLNIYILLVLSANLTIGMANLLTMCQAAFYGIGAYIGTYFLMQFHCPLILILAIVSVVTGLFSFLVSYASVKLKGDYFVLATMGFQLIVYTILYNWTSVTRGPYGIPGIPGIKLFGILQIQGVYAYLGLSFAIMFLGILLFKYLLESPYGRVLRAIKANEDVVRSLGRNVTAIKSWAFFISAAVAGIAGVIYASYVSYIDPTSFTLDESIFIISALFIGGIGNVAGPVIGSLFVVLLPEILRFVGLPDSIAANLRQIIYGLSLILIVHYRPQGLFGKTVMK